MDTLAQLRSIMFEDIAVNSSEELPVAGMHCLCISAVVTKKAWQWQIQRGSCAIIMMNFQALRWHQNHGFKLMLTLPCCSLSVESYVACTSPCVLPKTWAVTWPPYNCQVS